MNNAPYAVDYRAAPGTKTRHTVVMAPGPQSARLHVTARHPLAVILRVTKLENAR